MNKYDVFRQRCVGTELKFALLPRRCFLSNKQLWFRRAYCQTAMWTGPGDPAFEHRWYDPREFLIAKLKGIV